MDEYNDPLRELFDRIDAKELDAMKDRREEEGLQLDFKRMHTSGEPSDADKRNLREVISGFANAAGGIVLWGVESKSPENKGDRSRFQGIVAVQDGERAAVRFHELTGVATHPPVSGVVHRAIAVEGGSVVKTFVPASDAGPHRTSDENGNYYRRHADSFRVMQHHEVADMFGRRVRPRLSIYHSQLRKPRGSYPAGALAECIVGIRNNGRGIARFPRLVLEPVNRCAAEAPYGLDGNGHNNLRRETWHTGAMVYSGGANDVVHPESVLEVTRLGISFVEIDPVQAQIAYTIFAEGVPPVRDILVLGQAELATMDRS